MSGEVSTMEDPSLDEETLPTNKDIVKNLEIEFATPQAVRRAGGLNSTLLNFDPKKDHMRVYLRVRPFSEDERNRGEDQKCIEKLDEHTIMTHAPKDSHTYKNSVHGNTKANNKFTFSKIFHEDTTQKDFFDSCMLGTVKDFVDGQNCLVFTYGVTNSGKTYTIQGEPKDGGILPRALDVLFNSISGKQLDGMILKPKMFCDVIRLTSNQEEQEKTIKDNTLKMANAEEPDVTSLIGDNSYISTVNSTMSEDSLMSRASIISTQSTSKQSLPGKESLEMFFEESEERVREEASVDVDFQGQIKFSVWVSFGEIYNEQIFDLMEPPPKKKNARRTVLHLREDKNGVPYIRGLKEICVNSADEAYKILTIGKNNLQFACTKLNHNSSRSHCIFTVKLLRVVDKENPNMARMSMLSFCDLAGSERYSKTQSLGERIKEAGNINTSLLTLGRCIKTLRNNQMNKDHQQIVPYRESRLTRIFQGFFCGKGRASMIVNINQVASLFDETLHALKYSAIAQQVIVIQEPEEEKKPPPKKRGFVSLALANDGKNRTTIGWATPTTLAKMIEEEEAGVNLPLPECDDEDLEEPEDNQQLNGLIEIIDDLKKQLKDEKRKNRHVEMSIREEVCREMAQQLIAIETQYSERVKEAQYLAEEKAEKKIELLTMSMKKTRKRKRIIDQDDDEEYVPSLLLHAEQIKVEEKMKEIDRLKRNNAQIEDQLKQLMNEKDANQEKVSKLEFESKHLNDKLSEIRSMAEEQYQLLKDSQEQVQRLDECVRQRDQRIASLEEFQQSKDSDETTCLMCQVNTKDMEKLASKLTDAEDGLEEKDEVIERMQQMVDMLNCDISDKDSKIDQLNENLSKSQQNDDGEESKQTSGPSEDELIQMQAEMTTLNEKLAGKSEEVKKFIEENTALKENIASYETTQAENDCIAADIKQKLENSDTKLESYCSELSSLKIALESKTTELNVLNEQLASAKDLETKLLNDISETKTLLQENSDLYTASKVEVETLSEEICRVKQLLESKTKEISTLRNASDLNEAMKERLNCLEEELSEAKKNLKEEISLRDTQLRQVRAKLQDVETNLHDKELDLTKCGTDMFETLEKMSENESTLTTLKASLNQFEQEKVELNKTIDSCKVKIAGLECSLSMANETVGEVSEMSVQIETLEKKLVEKENELATLTSEMETLRESLDSETGSVTALEVSMHQANEIVRNKALELTTAGTKLEEKELQVEELENTIENMKETLEDYVLKLNELAESKGQIEDDYLIEKEKVKTLSVKLMDVQSELGILKSERESESDNEVIEQLQLTLQSEKQSFDSKLIELEKNVEEKTRQLERINVECDRLKKNYENEKKESKDYKSQLKELECVLENVEQQLASEKEKRKENKAENSKLQLVIHELESAVKESENKLQESSVIVNELNIKVNNLQASLDEAGDLEEELRDINVQLEEVSKDREKQLTKIKELQAEIQERNSKEDNEEMTELRTKICRLEAKVDDAEYKHQISMRQMRREKSQVEKLLKETESTLAGTEDKVLQLELQADEAKACANAVHEEKVEQLTKKTSKLEAIVQDLEHCLRSSKESETKVQNTAEEYRQKYSEVEAQYATVEDKLKDLYDKRDSIASQKDHEETCFKTVLKQKQKEIESLRSTISDSKEEISALKSMIEQDEDNCPSEVSALREEIKTLQNIIDLNTKDYGSQMYDKNEQIHALEKTVEEMTEKYDNIINVEIAESSSDKEMHLLTANIQELENKIKSREAEIEVKQCRVDTLESDIQQVKESLEEKTNELKGKVDTINEKESAVNELKAKVQSLDIEMKQVMVTNETKLEEQQGIVEGITAERNEKEEKLVALQGHCSELEEKLLKLQVQYEQFQEKAEASDSVSILEGEIISLKQHLEDVSKTKESLDNELVVRENSIQNYNKTISLLKEELQQLTDQLQKSQDGESKLRVQMRDWSDQMQAENTKFILLQENLKKSEMKLEQCQTTLKDQEQQITAFENEVKKLKETVSEKDSELFKVEREGQKNLDKMELEVKQLHLDIEAKEKKIDKKNKHIAELLEEGQKERNKYELAYKDSTANEQVIERLKKALEEQEQVMEMQDIHLKKKEEEFEATSKDLETVSEKYNALLKESAEITSQLRQLEHLQKKAQKDSTENDQELKNLKEKIEQLKQQLEKAEVENKLSASDRSNTNGELETLQNQLSELKHEHKKVKQQVEKTEREKSSLDNDIKDCTNEIRAMEKELNNARKEREQLRRELEISRNSEAEIRQVKEKLEQENSLGKESRGQAQLLKQKFQNLEEQKHQLEKEVDVLKDKIKVEDEKKELELQKWRIERDKLVSQLQEILVKKDEDITSLKNQINTLPTSEGAKQVLELKSQLNDKDAIIAELSSHLDRGAPKTRRGRGKKAQVQTGSDEELGTLKKELGSMHEQLEKERQKYTKDLETVRKAKDEIISYLKGTNQTLQSQMMQTPAGDENAYPYEKRTEENMAVQCDLEGTPEIVTKPQIKSKGKGRQRTRNNSDTDDVSGETEILSSKSKASRGGKRKSTRQTNRVRQKSLRLDENDEQSMGVIKEEDVVDLSMIEHNRSTGKILNNSTNLIDHGPVVNSTPKSDHRTATFVSPITEPVPPSTIKKKRRLRKTEETEPFAASPNDPTESVTSQGDPHKIVSRKLRTRKR